MSLLSIPSNLAFWSGRDSGSLEDEGGRDRLDRAGKAPAKGVQYGTRMSELVAKRRSPRIQMQIPVLLCWAEGQVEHQEHTFTVSISWFGCAVYSPKYFGPGTRVRVERDTKSMEARVVYSRWSLLTSSIEVGLEFDQHGWELWGIGVWGE